jgi:type IV pilus assembly protein PilC
MIDAGLTMLRALTIMSEQVEKPELRRVLRQVKQDLEAGMSLSSAFAKSPDVFPTLMVSMTRAGEAGGFLDVAMRQIADNFEAEVKLRQKIKAAMTYPVVVFILAIVMCMGMLVFVVPVFESMFEGSVASCRCRPSSWCSCRRPMRFMLPISSCHASCVSGCGGSSGRPLRCGTRRPAEAELPVFGDLSAKLALARFARNLSTLLSSGVPILQSLDIVAEDDRVRRDLPCAQGRPGVGTPGRERCGAVGAARGVPPMVVQMIASGEETGAIDQMLAKIAQF